LYLDTLHTLWIGTAGGGLNWLKSGQITRFTTREGLPDNTVSQILEDAAGRLWMGGNRGIACVNKRALQNLASGGITTLYPQVYGLAEGMPSEECTSGFFPAALRSKSGLLWFSTTKGVVSIDASHYLPAESSPRVMLEQVLVDGEPVAELPAGDAGGSPELAPAADPNRLNIPPGRHRLELLYTGLGFDSPEQTRFRYRLEGLDTDWTDAGTRRVALYNYVPPGNYRFRVTGCDSEGVWTDKGADLALNVARHFWQMGWVLALASLGLTVSAAGTVRMWEKRKSQRRLKRLEQERALERERTRIAQDLHDEMGAKLCRISFLSEHARRIDHLPTELQQQISSISDASREVLHSLDEIVWAVNPQNDSLEHLASYIGQYAQDYFQMTGIDCELDIPAELPRHPLSSQARHHLFLAVHEAFTNILKHSGASHARVSVTCSTSQFEIVAADDGKGFVPPLMPSGEENSSADSGDGLRNMQRRLDAIGGSCRVESQPGQGTTIRFLIPLNPVSQEK
jgi:signal transduction histidine kinase